MSSFKVKFSDINENDRLVMLNVLDLTRKREIVSYRGKPAAIYSTPGVCALGPVNAVVFVSSGHTWPSREPLILRCESIETADSGLYVFSLSEWSIYLAENYDAETIQDWIVRGESPSFASPASYRQLGNWFSDWVSSLPIFRPTAITFETNAIEATGDRPRGGVS